MNSNTDIERLVVIAILAILISLSALAVTRGVNSARNVLCANNLRFDFSVTSVPVNL